MAKQPDKTPVGLNGFLSDDLAPAFWTPDLPIEESRWWPHVPFAFWLVVATKPRSLVELGTGRGVSYSAFCEAAARVGLDARFCAIDIWSGGTRTDAARTGDALTGDGETGFHDESAFASLRAFHDRRYAAFSTLIRSDFEQALPRFTDGSIDLLHIDGMQGYDEARRHFEMWRDKLSPRAVVLLHGTRLSCDGFGVSKLFAELGADAPHFEFPQGDGLGLIGVGAETPDALSALFGLRDEGDIGAVKNRFAFLGQMWSERAIALSIVQQFDQDIAVFNPWDQRIRFPLHLRFVRSVFKTIDDPLRHFKKSRQTP